MPLPGLVGGWAILETSGSTLNDDTGNNDLTISAGTLESDGPFGQTFLHDAALEGAVSGNATNDVKIQAPITIVWQGRRVGTPDVGANIGSVVYDNAATFPFFCYGFTFQGVTATRARAVYNRLGAFIELAPGASAEIALDTTVQLALTMDGTNAEFFIDGVSVDSLFLLQTINYTATTLVAIGDYISIGSTTNVETDILAIFDRVLPVSDMNLLAAYPKTFGINPSVVTLRHNRRRNK